MSKKPEFVELQKIVKFYRGLTYSKKDEVEYSSNIVLRANNVNLEKNLLDLSDLRYISDDVLIPEGKKVKKGALIICIASGSKTHLGKIAYIDDNYDYAFGGFMGMLVPTASINSRYLYYIMTSDRYKDFIDSLSDGVNINNLRFDDLGKFLIPLPPLAEQQRIVALLDQALSAIDNVKANTEKNLQSLSQLFNSYFLSVFDSILGHSQVQKIGDVADLMTGGTPSKTHLEYFANGNIKWLVSGDIHQMEIFDCKGRISIAGLQNSNAKFLPENSVLIALNGQGKTRGTVALLRTKATCNQSLVSIFPKKLDSLTPEYIFWNLKGRYNELRKMTGDAGNERRGLNMPIIKNIEIPVPPLEIQIDVVNKLDDLNCNFQKLEIKYQEKLAALQELKQSILHKAFSGEL